MSFAEFSKNLKTGFAEGMALTEAGLKKGATRQYNKAMSELEDYLNYDPYTAVGGAVEGEKPPPTSRDLNGLRVALQDKVAEASRRMKKAGMMANDLEWKEKADALWARTLSDGFSKYVGIAAQALETGDNDAAERALNHAGGLLPSGGAYRFKRNEDGNFVMTGVDEVTGEVVEQRIVTPSDLQMLSASKGDPIAYLTLVNQQGSLFLKRRKQLMDEENSAVKRALDITGSVENLAQAEKALSDSGLSKEWTRASAERRQQNQNVEALNKRLKELFDGPNLKDLPYIMKNQASIRSLANAIYIADNMPPNAQQYADAAVNLVAQANGGDKEAQADILQFAPELAHRMGWGGLAAIPLE